jgi:hypothetical protein
VKRKAPSSPLDSSVDQNVIFRKVAEGHVLVWIQQDGGLWHSSASLIQVSQFAHTSYVT